MSERVIPLVDQRHPSLPRPQPTVAGQVGLDLRDRLQRPLHDLRISVTDRCNFRCSYCMPKEVFDQNYRYLPHADLLSFEEITRVAQAFVGLGVRKIRLTGGEPLLRKHIETLIGQLARLPSPQPLDLTLTTNGALLARKARDLAQAGLRRITVSLDGLDDAVFRHMNQVDFPVRDVLNGIEAAQQAGLGPIKVNMVVQRGVNDHEIIPMARHFRGSGVVLRFIEYMDVGETNGWRMDQVLPSQAVLERLQSEWSLVPLSASQPGETAERWGFAGPDGRHDPALGEIGLISSVTQAFCGDCNRARLSTDGRLFLCLFARQGHDLRHLLRQEQASDALLAATLDAIWRGRSDQYSRLRGLQAPDPGTAGGQRVEMSYIGG